MARGFIAMWTYVREHGSVSGLKCLRRWGHGLVSSKRLVETGIKRGTPGYKATCFLVVEMKLYV